MFRKLQIFQWNFRQFMEPIPFSSIFLPKIPIHLEKNSKQINSVLRITVTYIFIVPFGPKLVFITSCKPFDAEILMANAWAARAVSAFGFNKLIEDIFYWFLRTKKLDKIRFVWIKNRTRIFEMMDTTRLCTQLNIMIYDISVDWNENAMKLALSH